MTPLEILHAFMHPSISTALSEKAASYWSAADGRDMFLCWLAVVTTIFIVLSCIYRWKKPSIYLIDYSCVKYSDENKTTLEMMLFFLKSKGTISDKDIMFQNKVFLKSGISEEAYVPRPNLEKGRFISMQDSYNQAHILVVGAVDILLKKTGTVPSQIDILIVNSGMFNPTPSLTSLLINHFKMREDVKSFQLGGMGCSAGLISVDLGKDLLTVHKDARYALIASTEVIQALYDGTERAMMVTNCLFRSAGNALLLSNRKRDRERAKMELMHVVRVNTAGRDEAHNAVVVKEDKEGIWGANLSPQLIQVASEALIKNIESLAPKVLPLGELCKAGWTEVQRKVFKIGGVKAYVPNFKLAFQHFCIHPGGKAVIEGVGKGLNLHPHDIEPSLMALYRFGNTSCSGVWYILAYMEAKQRLKKDEKVWQIGLGSGFKCTTAVWRMLRDVKYEQGLHVDNPWHDCIHRYPVVDDLSSQPHVISFVEFLHKTLDVPAK